MDKIFVVRLAASAAFLFCLTACSVGKSILIKGTASTDSSPVVNGSIFITELNGPWFAKPRRLANMSTSADGTFRAELRDVRGIIDIRLEEKRCVRSGAVVQIDTTELEQGATVIVELRAADSAGCELGP
jgi:hypothetical protein